MLPSSHQVQRKTEIPPVGGGELAEAFSDFIAASGRLEHSYRELQAEVAELRRALSEQNRALAASLSKNRALEDIQRQILEVIPAGVLVVAADGVIRLANPEASRLLSLQPQTAGRAGAPVNTSADWSKLLQPVMEGTSEEEQEFSLQDSGEGQWVAARKVILPSLQAAERVEETLVILRDISARKRLEKDRDGARDAVALAQVSALLAHEIRNPLASLELFAGLLLEEPERNDEWLAYLRAGIRSLSGTVNNVLTLHGGLPLPVDRLNVIEEASFAVSFLQPLAQQAGVHLRLEATAAALWTRANKSAFHQIVFNLCSNALRHTPEGGEVKITCTPPPSITDPIKLCVSDNGCGIAEDLLARIFDAGFSGSGTTPGLGLAVCKRLAVQHGGAIHVQSRVGFGSAFTLEVPQA